jgi:hypothetical protein
MGTYRRDILMELPPTIQSGWWPEVGARPVSLPAPRCVAAVRPKPNRRLPAPAGEFPGHFGPPPGSGSGGLPPSPTHQFGCPDGRKVTAEAPTAGYNGACGPRGRSLQGFDADLGVWTAPTIINLLPSVARRDPGTTWFLHFGALDRGRATRGLLRSSGRLGGPRSSRKNISPRRPRLGSSFPGSPAPEPSNPAPY